MRSNYGKFRNFSWVFKEFNIVVNIFSFFSYVSFVKWFFFSFNRIAVILRGRVVIMVVELVRCGERF